jgi:hypothetical protein
LHCRLQGPALVDLVADGELHRPYSARNKNNARDLTFAGTRPE